MKRLFLVFAYFVLCSVNMLSQSQMAVLSHNGEIKVFYGYEALVQACEEIENGDVITLSSGSFEAADIGAAITVRGEGMVDNKENGRQTTYICGDFAVAAEVGIGAKMMFEGICFTETVHSFDNMDYLSFNKCKFLQEGFPGGVYCPKESEVKKCIFTNCLVDGVYMDSTYVEGYNSVFQRPCAGSFNHCIMVFDGNGHQDQFKNIHFVNGIAVARGHVYFLDGVYFNGSIIVRPGTFDDGYFHMSDSAKGAIIFVEAKSEAYPYAVFKNYPDSPYTWGLINRDDFELREEYKVVSLPLLTTDGTECGVYGGVFPYSPHLEMPTITDFKVQNKSDKNGKLGVDIKVD